MPSAEYDRDAVLRKRHAGSLSRQRLCQDHHAGAGGRNLACTGSLYAAFGNKRGLLLAAVDHYVAEKGPLRRCCSAQPSPAGGLHAYLEQVVDDAPVGLCLLTPHPDGAGGAG